MSILCPPEESQEESHLLWLCGVHGRELSLLQMPLIERQDEVSPLTHGCLLSVGVKEIPAFHCLTILSKKQHEKSGTLKVTLREGLCFWKEKKVACSCNFVTEQKVLFQERNGSP